MALSRPCPVAMPAGPGLQSLQRRLHGDEAASSQERIDGAGEKAMPAHRTRPHRERSRSPRKQSLDPWIGGGWGERPELAAGFDVHRFTCVICRCPVRENSRV